MNLGWETGNYANATEDDLSASAPVEPNITSARIFLRSHPQLGNPTVPSNHRRWGGV
jgi:hypothetical protein